MRKLALKIDTQIEHSNEEIQNSAHVFKYHGKFLQKIEGEKFELWELDNALGLFSNSSNSEFIGFMKIQEIENNPNIT